MCEGGTRCDVDSDGDVDLSDLAAIRAALGQLASSPNDPRDGNGDGRINSGDYRYCSLRLTANNNTAASTLKVATTETSAKKAKKAKKK